MVHRLSPFLGIAVCALLTSLPPFSAVAAEDPFILFFDFRSTGLSAEAKVVVARAVAEARRRGQVRILVHGHTDTDGDPNYNQVLSEKRAESVKAEMVRTGVDASAIVTEGRGFREPVAPTAAGVRDPHNRRAVIEFLP
jgi:outer membrane protein OmpA-like peptidoglycan-associated protein